MSASQTTQMEVFSALLAHCAGNSPVTGDFAAQRPSNADFDVFFDVSLNKRLHKQLRAGDLRKVCRFNFRNTFIFFGQKTPWF